VLMAVGPKDSLWTKLRCAPGCRFGQVTLAKGGRVCIADCGLQIADWAQTMHAKGACVCAGTGYKVTFIDNQGLTFIRPVTLRLQPVTFGYKCLLRASFWVSGSVLPVTSVTWLHTLIIKGLYFARRLHCGYNRLHFVAPRPAGSTQRFTEANEGNEEI
jgi:hypothetical protein